MMISIKGLTKAEALKALYDNARPLGMGYLHFTPEPMTLDEAAKYFKVGDDNASRVGYFDYLKGRVMKVDLNKDEFNPALYDRDNGQGSAAAAIEEALSLKSA